MQALDAPPHRLDGVVGDDVRDADIALAADAREQLVWVRNGESGRLPVCLDAELGLQVPPELDVVDLRGGQGRGHRVSLL